MKLIEIPKFKLSNVLNNILLYGQLTGNKSGSSSPEKAKETIEMIINDIQNNPSILDYFNYSEEEYAIIEDVILNGLEYPGVREDFIQELVRKNEISLYDENTIFIMLNLKHNKDMKYYLLKCVAEARRTGSQVKFI